MMLGPGNPRAGKIGWVLAWTGIRGVRWGTGLLKGSSVARFFQQVRQWERPLDILGRFIIALLFIVHLMLIGQNKGSSQDQVPSNLIRSIIAEV